MLWLFRYCRHEADAIYFAIFLWQYYENTVEIFGRSLYKYSSHRGLARLFTSVHGRRHARWDSSSRFCGSLYDGRSVRDPSARTTEKDGSRISLSLRLHLDDVSLDHRCPLHISITVSLSVGRWEIGCFVFSGSEIEAQQLGASAGNMCNHMC